MQGSPATIQFHTWKVKPSITVVISIVPVTAMP